MAYTTNRLLCSKSLLHHFVISPLPRLCSTDTECSKFVQTDFHNLRTESKPPKLSEIFKQHRYQLPAPSTHTSFRLDTKIQLDKSFNILKIECDPQNLVQIFKQLAEQSSFHSLRSPYEVIVKKLAFAKQFDAIEEILDHSLQVEAYRQNDTACHGRFGITARTAPVFGPGGHAYVYLCYGLHIMLNVVADKKGVGAAVLIRSCAPVSGLETIQCRRGQTTDKPILLTGPGKVGQALGLTTEWSNHPLYTCGGLEVLDGPAPDKILVGPRIGIEYASPEDVQALWRFAIGGSAWISAPRNTLRPA